MTAFGKSFSLRQTSTGRMGVSPGPRLGRLSNLTIANFHLYRVVSSFQPFPYAVTISDSHNIRFRNFHCYSDSKVSFDNAVFDQTAHVEICQREFVALTLRKDARHLAGFALAAAG